MMNMRFQVSCDDVVLNIFLKLEDDARNWARLTCICTKFSALLRNVCWKNKYSQTIPSVVSDLLSSSFATVTADPPGGWAALHKLSVCCPGFLHGGLVSEEDGEKVVVKLGGDISVCKKRRKTCGSITGHLASGVWNLSREQGNKLLASRFRGDCLYICDWPGCLHTQKGGDYMLFRGIFKNFKQSQVFGYHYDGEPVVRAYVCENGHVSGAWTVRPIYA
ncbi:hypothetical protein HHK36_005829 [Tetracentron sinense]|uniref:F-box domain-containing protein n=1 Tax=Tetracentron sinense TaxID=13715 RepID=A0A834ZQ61_TETSI|nr:hypothetical protein HHK36_005829 [Tetracentron sinense]